LKNRPPQPNPEKRQEDKPMTTPLIDSLIALSGQDNVVVIRKPFVKFTGSLEAGILLGQLLYWTPRARIPGGWIAKTDKDFMDELCLSRHAVRKARKRMEEMKILETTRKRFNGSPTVHYRLNLEELQKQWIVWIATMDCTKTDNPSSENAQSLTETTTETTTEHGADAPTQPSPIQEEPAEKVGEELLNEFFEPQQEKEPAPITPHWTKRIIEDWTAWGIKSEEMQRQLAIYGEHGRTVQHLGYELERQFALYPIWRKKSDVKSWMSGLAACLELAEGDEKIVTRAARELIDGGMTVADPWSLHKKTRAIVAETKRQATTDREYIV